MKRFIKILALCMLVAMVAMTFASCGLLGGDLSKIKSRLNKKDYAVITISSDSQIESIVEAMFEEYGLSSSDEMPEKALFTTTEDGESVLVIYEFKNSIKALQAYNDDYEDALKLAADDLPEDYGEATYGISGKLLYVGTVDACKDAFGFPMNLFIKEK